MKKLLIGLMLFLPVRKVFSQVSTSVFNTTNNLSSAIGTTLLSKYAKGYVGLTTNGAVGAFVDFKVNTTLIANLVGDKQGLSLEVPTGYGMHLWANGKENMTFLTNGFVGLGTTAPVAKLDVFGTFITGGKGVANIDPKQLKGNLSYLAGSGQMMIGWNRSAGQGETDFVSNMGDGTVGGFAFFNYGDGTTTNANTNELMRITGTGQVIIGSSTWSNLQQQKQLGSNMLAVGGGVLTESVTVKTQSNWPDYVFEPTYRLPALKDLKLYLNTNHHLPGMPGASDIEKKNGQNLGELNNMLVKKIEELTLYIIQKDDQQKDQQHQMDIQKKQLLTQEARIEKLENALGKNNN